MKRSFGRGQNGVLSGLAALVMGVGTTGTSSGCRDTIYVVGTGEGGGSSTDYGLNFAEEGPVVLFNISHDDALQLSKGLNESSDDVSAHDIGGVDDWYWEGDVAEYDSGHEEMVFYEDAGSWFDGDVLGIRHFSENEIEGREYGYLTHCQMDYEDALNKLINDHSSNLFVVTKTNSESKMFFLYGVMPISELPENADHQSLQEIPFSLYNSDYCGDYYPGYNNQSNR